MLHVDLDDATVIYLCATCFRNKLLQEVLTKVPFVSFLRLLPALRKANPHIGVTSEHAAGTHIQVLRAGPRCNRTHRETSAHHLGIARFHCPCEVAMSARMVHLNSLHTGKCLLR